MVRVPRVSKGHVRIANGLGRVKDQDSFQSSPRLTRQIAAEGRPACLVSDSHSPTVHNPASPELDTSLNYSRDLELFIRAHETGRTSDLNQVFNKDRLQDPILHNLKNSKTSPPKTRK